jgi:hypothetical protein
MARALASNPDVLVLGSPTAGVDIAAKQALFGIIRSLESAVLIVSDEIDDLANMPSGLRHVRRQNRLRIPGIVARKRDGRCDGGIGTMTAGAEKAEPPAMAPRWRLLRASMTNSP